MFPINVFYRCVDYDVSLCFLKGIANNKLPRREGEA